MTPAYFDVMVKLFILGIGFLIGFLFACGAAARIIAEKNDLKVENAKLKGENDQLKSYNKELFDENRDMSRTLELNNIPKYGKI